MNSPIDAPRREEPERTGDGKPRSRSSSRMLRPIEKAVFAHVSILLVLSTWYFAGGSALAQLLIMSWGSVGALLTLFAFFTREPKDDELRRTLHWLWPVVGFNALVLASCVNPSFTEKFFRGESYLAATGATYTSLPSTAHVTTSLQHLWMFDALYFSGFNLALVIRRRRALRGLLIVAAANAVVLSVFGTLQKLTSNGLFFGAVPSPNPRFFATFIYGNHWSAFVALVIAATIGLVFHYSRRHDNSPRIRSLILNGIIGIVLMAITPFITGSRAGTIMAAVLLLAAGVNASMRVWRRERDLGQLATGPLIGLLACAGVAVGGAIWLGNEAMEQRVSDTREQLAAGGVFQGRADLYSDTWKLAKDKPVFGWGLGTYSKVFGLVRPRPLEARRQYERSYADAHSDWLQAIVEVGFTGALLVALTVVLPLLKLHRQHFNSGLTSWALAGCAIVLLYATVEFPFANAAVVLTWWICFFCAVQNARLRDAAVRAAKLQAVRQE